MMLHSFQRNLTVLTWALLGLLVVQSQAQNLEKVEKIKTKITMVSLFSIKGSNLYIQPVLPPQPKKAGKKKEEPPFQRVQVANFRMLNPTFYEGPVRLKVFDKPGGSQVGKITLKGGHPEYVVVVFPSRKESSGLKYEMLAFNASKGSFPGGARRLFNLSAYPVKGEWGRMPFKLGDEKNRKFVVESMKSVIIRPPSANAEKDESQPVVMDYLKGDKWTNFISSRWFHELNKRHYVFLYTTTKRNAVVIKSISERVDQ